MEVRKIYYETYMTVLNITKSGMNEYYTADLDWLGLAWLDLDTW